MIATSLRDLGAGRSILLDADNTVIAGNGVYEQAEKLGLRVKVVEADGKTLIAVKRPDLRGTKARRMALVDNRATETSEWNADVLADLYASDQNLLEGLWDDGELRGLLGDRFPQAEETVDVGELIDRAAELQKKWKVRRGDIWQCGRHRLMCGDSTSNDDVRKLGGGTAALGFSSPPYWVGKEYERQKSVEEIDAFIRAICVSFNALVRKDESRIVINTGTGYTTSFERRKKRQTLLLIDKWANHFFEIGWNLRHVRHWLKQGGIKNVTPRGDIIDQHCEFLGTFEADDGEEMTFRDWPSDDVAILETLFNPAGLNRGGERTGEKWALLAYWDDIPRGIQTEGHPAVFDVELPRRHIFLYTKQGEAVIDLFLGSGTTIVACEQTGRVGRGMELEPRYVSVALERLAAMGLECRRVEDGTRKGAKERERAR